LSISIFAYVYARRHAFDQRFSFGTGKVNSLAGFTGAILLALFALVMGWESIARLAYPVEIAFNSWHYRIPVFSGPQPRAAPNILFTRRLAFAGGLHKILGVDSAYRVGMPAWPGWTGNMPLKGISCHAIRSVSWVLTPD
jgi:cation efflux family protein